MSKIEVTGLSVFYGRGTVQALKEVSIKIEAKKVTALIG
ncbi:MAG TPA: phosphate ABC transporter ATP-binding protein, partial [Methanomicrobia archaeon]|nr:phosphate ABC transporter ATP-binding protein [Methanomicrobia archaeon]